ncbi:MAG: MarR family winged helix-turn-helix transcriptional regulator [Victivallaceae bacterium]
MELEKSRELLREWLKIQACTENVYTTFIKRFQLSKNAFFALDYLNTHPEGEEPALLADYLGLTRQMMTIVLNDLDERGFIQRHERQDDHRRKTILLSKLGKSTADEVCQSLEDFDIAALAEFSDEELCNMFEFSTRFYEKIKLQLENSQLDL